MKHILLLLIAITLVSSCKKAPDPPVDPSPFWGEASATINGKLWLAQPTAAINCNHGHGWDIEIDFGAHKLQLFAGLCLFPGWHSPGVLDCLVINSTNPVTFHSLTEILNAVWKIPPTASIFAFAFEKGSTFGPFFH